MTAENNNSKHPSVQQAPIELEVEFIDDPECEEFLNVASGILTTIIAALTFIEICLFFAWRA